LTATPALADPRLERLEHRVVRHGPVSSLEEAATARGVAPAQVIKTMVVRRAASDYLFVLVPGDRNISWPKLRNHLSVNRVSMPDADEARAVTGYERGTITPFGSTISWPVLADQSLADVVSIGAGAPGLSLTVDAEDLVAVLGATVADITEPV
jgi:Cys-tRNA(Pro)/Cys-tRNA(Cys) deacylase